MTDVAGRRTTRSGELMERAGRLFPGGVNSPVRAFGAVGGTPRVIDRGAGARLWDVDGNEYVDYIGSWGPMILGHAHPAVVEAVQEAAARGTSYGAPNALELELGEEIVAAMPSIERLRFVSSGTEAAMSALRVARGFAGRDKIIKLAGGYHGHADGLLVRAGSGAAGIGRPTSAGVTAATAAETLVAPYNDLDAVERLLDEQRGQVAALIVEPVAANMGVVLPAPGFLEGLRRLTAEHGALLIFDEVITGFRVARGGAQALYGVRPDLTVLGKIIGGGLPVGAYGGRADVMALVAPDGPVYQAGTLSGNPLAMAAGLATLRALTDDVYARLESRSAELETALTDTINGLEVDARVGRLGSLLTVFFADEARFARFFHDMLDRGVMLPPSQQEAWFISSAHGESDLDQTKDAALMAFGAELGDKLAKQLEAIGANSPARQPRPTALTPEIVSALDGEELEVTKSFSVG
jgi:glutamate-1-semialdehyde 2,1-aminomutase